MLSSSLNTQGANIKKNLSSMFKMPTVNNPNQWYSKPQSSSQPTSQPTQSGMSFGSQPVNLNNAFSSGGLSMGSNPGLLDKHTPTGTVKKIVDSKGNQVHFDNTSTASGTSAKAPDDPSNKFNTATGQPNPNWVGNQNQQNTQSQPQPPAQGNGTNTNSNTSSGLYTPPDQGMSGINQGGLIGNLVNNSQNSSQEYKDAMANYQKDLEAYNKMQQDEATSLGNIAGQAIPLNFQQGRGQVVQSQYGSRLAGLGGLVSGDSNALGAANTQQGLQQGALTSALGYNAPQFQSYTNAQYNPSSGTYGTVGGGQYGSGPGAASNVASVGQAQTGINDIRQKAPFIDNQFSTAINYARQAGLTGDSPILTGFQNKFGANFMTNPAVVGFNAAVNSLNAELQKQGEPTINLDTATQAKLQQAQQTIKDDLQRKQQSYQDFLNSFQTGNNQTSTQTNTQNQTSTGGSSYSSPESIKQVQQYLGITADGQAGPQTKAAIKAFQQAHGLTVDGIAGPQTRAAMGLSSNLSSSGGSTGGTNYTGGGAF